MKKLKLGNKLSKVHSIPATPNAADLNSTGQHRMSVRSVGMDDYMDNRPQDLRVSSVFVPPMTGRHSLAESINKQRMLNHSFDKSLASYRLQD